MAVSPYKTFVALEILTASDLNNSFSRIYDNGEDLAWPATKAKDLNAQKLILDTDDNTSITADTDDQIDFELQGEDLFIMDGTAASSVNGLTFTAGTVASPTVTIAATGTSASLFLNLAPKGAGTLLSNGSQVFPIETDDYHLAAQIYGR